MADAIQSGGAETAEELLLDYASGALPEPVSVLVATQLVLRPDLHRRVADIEAIGGHLIEEIAPTELSDDAFDAVWEKIGAAEAAGAPANDDRSTLPEQVRACLAGKADAVSWRWKAPGIESCSIAQDDDRYEMSLLRLAPGRKVPHHGHAGTEFTLVLEGAFDDEDGHYGRGDIAVGEETDEHTPVADPETGCVCLVVTGGALKFSNPLVRLYDRVTRG